MEEKIIFTDCFDTLVFRNTSVNQIFRNWSQKLSEKTNIPSFKIYKKYKNINFRLCAFKTLRHHILEEHFDIVLSKVYDSLCKKHELCSRSDFISLASELYYEEERKALYLNEKYVKFLNECKSVGKKIYLVSDFYCSSDIIKSWLTTLGVEKLFDGIYVSCDFDKEKATGKLYDYLLDKMKVPPEDIIMIGDNHWSDNIMADKKNIHTQNINDLYPKKEAIIDEEWDEIFYRFDKKYVLSNHAFPLFLFTKRLFEDVKKNGYKDVIFMSREGQFLKMLFDYYVEKMNSSGTEQISVKTHYFYGSRNSVMAASLDPLEEEKFDLIFRFFICLSVKSFLHSIGFSASQIEEVKASFPRNITRMHLVFNISSAFRALKKNETFRRIYEENRTTQSKAFGAYMESFGIDYKKNGLVFVDIGYHGTMQDLINKFYKGKINIKGYFIKTRVSKKEMNSKIGLLSDKANKKLIGNSINKFDAYNYEQILRADHGRCLGYSFDNDGKAYAILDKELDDAEVFEKYVKEMQSQIYDKFKSITGKSITEKRDITSLCLIYFYFAIKNKGTADFDWIIDMQDSSHDDFGIVGYFGRIFSKRLRNFLFKKQDNGFVRKNKNHIRKLIEQMK